ncbi:MAG: MFS transporter, partial [Staphylococcus simulans]|nr:MFS transporter [Staphylococcus simulans]
METMTKRQEEKVETFKAIEKPKLPLKEKIAYGFGDLGNGMMFDLGQIYLLKFYTDVLGISATYAGLVFLISKIFDAFVDTGVGSYVDSRKNIGPRGKF